jgi:hypothetical protein
MFGCKKIMIQWIKNFRKPKQPEKIPLDALYFRLYIRERRLKRWAEMPDSPKIIVRSDELLLAKVKAEIEERHREIQAQAEEFGK